MAHYAKVLNGIVKEVIVADSDFFDSFVDTSPGKWIQTSYNTRAGIHTKGCLLYTSPSPRDQRGSRMPSSA